MSNMAPVIQDLNGHVIMSPDDCGFAPMRDRPYFKGARNADVPAWERKRPKTADRAYLPDRDELVAQSRHLYENCEMTHAAVEMKVDMSVGTHIRLKPTFQKELLGLSSSDHRELTSRIKRLFKLHSESKFFWMDASGKSTATQLAANHLRQYLIDGEGMANIYQVRNPKGPVSFAVGQISTDRVYTPQSAKKESRIIRGVQMNSRGLPEGYYVHNKHPGEATMREGWSYVRKRSAAGREQFIHSYLSTSPDLTRGISDIVRSLPTMQKKEKWVDAAIEDAIIKARLALVITSNKADVGEVLGADPLRGGVSLDDYMEQAIGYHEGMNLRFGGEQMARLYDGEKLDGFSPSSAGNEFASFCSVIDSISARAHGLSAEMFTQRWNETNYSGARAGLLPIWKMISGLRKRVPFDFMQRIYCLWMEDVILSGELELPGYSNPIEAWSFFQDNREALTDAEWYGPPKDEIDRAKTADAYLAEKGIGVSTAERYCNEVLGVDWEDNAEQIIHEVKRSSEIMEDCGLGPIDDMQSVIVERLFGSDVLQARTALRESGAASSE